MYRKNSVLGEVKFEDQVIKNTVGIAVSSCYGVVEMASVKRIKDVIFSSIQKDYYEQGIEIHCPSEGIIDLGIHVVLGYSIPVKSVCHEIKNRVAYELEKNLNLKARHIYVYVEAIDKIG